MTETTSLAWIAKVLDAMHGVASKPLSHVALAPVADALGLPPEAIAEPALTGGEGVGAALFQAMGDLDGMSLIEFANVSYGNTLTQAGRDVHDLGLPALWPDIFDIHLDERALMFLRRLAAASEVRRDGWAERHAVEARRIYADLDWTQMSEYDLVNDIHALVDVLHQKEMVTASGPMSFGNMLVTPTYVGMVRATATDPRAPGRAAGILDWSDPVQGWEGIEDELIGLKTRLGGAVTEHDFEDIGRRVREIATDAVMHVVNGGMVPPGAKAPGERDADEWLDVYLAARLGGGSSKNLRDHLRTSLRLANEVTHGSRNRIVGAAAATQGLILLVRTLQAIERTSRPLSARA